MLQKELSLQGRRDNPRPRGRAPTHTKTGPSMARELAQCKASGRAPAHTKTGPGTNRPTEGKGTGPFQNRPISVQGSWPNANPEAQYRQQPALEQHDVTEATAATEATER